MPTARGYVRVSTEEQAVNGVSIDAQKEILQAYAVVKGYTDFKIYTDEGFSGKNLNRPDVSACWKSAAAGKWKLSSSGGWIAFPAPCGIPWKPSRIFLCLPASV